MLGVLRLCCLGIFFVYALTDSYVTNLSGGDVKSKLDSSELSVYNDSNFFRVAISSEFVDDNIGRCGILDDYELGGIVERRVISYSALQTMTDRYHNGSYEDLRSDLKVPAVFDFAIVAESLPGIVMESQFGIPTSVEVMAQDYVVEVLKEDGELTNERFTIMLW